jgi:hypothetical protein
MNQIKVGNWLQIVANVGIVVGLLLVGVQLKQNSDLMKTQLLYEESQRAIALETLVVGESGAEVWARSISDAGDLSLADQRIMEAMLWSFVEQLRATRMLSELGLLENEEWKARVHGESAFYLANDYGAAWWEHYSSGNSALTDDLITEINNRLSQVDNDFTADHFRSIIDSIND